jgi:hypothetical protein
MISKDEMMPLLLEACPSFHPQWHKFLDEWRDEAKNLPLYLALTDFARHLIGLLERDDRDSLVKVFAVVERLHVEGDEYVREAASIGLLEDLQNTGLHRRTSPADLRAMLEPESCKWWDMIEAFWEGMSPEV